MKTSPQASNYLLGLAMAIALPGCGEDGSPVAQSARSVASSPAPARPEAYGPKVRERAAEADDPVKSATANRKIIYNAHVDLVTEDLGKLDSALAKLIEARKAYIADSERSGTSGDNRHATWKVRVPVDAYDAFLQSVTALGELVSLKADSQDVGEEFFDLEARQVAKRAEEARLLKHLDVSTGKLEEILTVERELTRVRGEIERMQGRLRYLGNLTALATVTITVREIKGYVPPQAPTLATRIGRAFFTSVETLQAFGEAVLIFLAAVAPWLPLILLAAGIVFWITRKVAPRAQDRSSA